MTDDSGANFRPVMPRAPSPPYLEKRRQIWFCRLGVPRDVQHIIGKTVLIASTGERDQHQATLKAAPILAEWRNRIDTARKAASDPLQAEIHRLASLYRRTKKTDLDEAAAVLVTDVMRFALEHFGGLAPEKSHPSGGDPI